MTYIYHNHYCIILTSPIKNICSFFIIPNNFYAEKFYPVSCLFVNNCSLRTQEDLNVINSWIHFTDAPNALYHHPEKKPLI